MKNLTKEIINERINLRGLSLISKYINARTKSLFKCSKGHEWLTTPKIILSGCGCPECDNHNLLTKEIVNKRIAYRDIELVGKYINARTKSLFKCSKGHEWSAKPSSVMEGRGCRTCAKQPILTKEIINKRLSYRNIIMIGDYSNTFTKTTFKCSKGHEWSAIPNSVMQGNNCKICSNGGGFNYDKPAILYYLKVETRIFMAFKIGVTNNSVELRFSPEELQKITVLKTWHYDKGRDAYDKEQEILKEFKDYKYKGDNLLSTGNTELFNKNVLGLKEVSYGIS